MASRPGLSRPSRLGRHGRCVPSVMPGSKPGMTAESSDAPQSIHRQRAREDRRPARRRRRRAGRCACPRRGRARPAARSITPTARCRCCACPRSSDDLAGIRRRRRQAARRRHRRGRSSAPAAPASAARRWRSSPAMRVPGVGALRDPPRMHFIDNLDPVSFDAHAGTAAAGDQPLRRDLQVRRHRRDLMQTIAALRRVKQAGLDPRDRRARHQRAGKAGQAQRPARSARQASGADARPRPRRRRPLLGADQCRPAAGRGARPRHRRDPPGRGRGAWRRCSANKPPAEVPAALGAALAVALAPSKNRSRC